MTHTSRNHNQPAAEPYRVRDAAPEDAGAIAALSIEVWLNTYATGGVSRAYGDHLTETFSRDAVLKDIADPRIRLIVCDRGGFLLGYVKLALEAESPLPDCGTAEIATLYVGSVHKRQGIGKKLLQRARALGREHGHDTLFLTVMSENAAAIAFYETMGLCCRGEWLYRFKDFAVPNRIYVAQTA